MIYYLAISIDGPIDADDSRTVDEQAEEWIESLVYWINDTCPGQVWAESYDASRSDLAEEDGA